jgi:hypothetical protein
MSEQQLLSSPYQTHAIALGRLLEWLRQGHTMKMGGAVRENILTLDDSLSQRFALGFPRKTEDVIKPQPFLAIQKTERAWMHPMIWKGAYVRPNDRRLYLLTSAIPSEDEHKPTLPSFALSITVNDADKLQLLFRERSQPKLEGRSMWIDEGQQVHVNLKQTMFSIPLVLLDERTPLPFDDPNRPWQGDSLQNKAANEYQNQMQAKPSIQMAPMPPTPGRKS